MALRRIAQILVLGAACGPLISCRLLYHDHVDMPPSDPRRAAGWCDTIVELVPPSVLATYIEVSEVHKRQGTSATYAEGHYFYTMMGGKSFTLKLPSPPPAEVLARLREKLTASGSTPSRETFRYDGKICVVESRGCTFVEAERIWKTVSARFPAPGSAAPSSRAQVEGSGGRTQPPNLELETMGVGAKRIGAEDRVGRPGEGPTTGTDRVSANE